MFITDDIMSWFGGCIASVAFDGPVGERHIGYIQDVIAAHEGKRLLLYPAGALTKNILEKMDLSKTHLLGVADKHKTGRFLNQPVYSPEDIPTLDPQGILICSESYEEEIRGELEAIVRNTPIKVYSIFDQREREIERHNKCLSIVKPQLPKRPVRSAAHNHIFFVSQGGSAQLCYRYSLALKEKYGVLSTLLHLGKYPDKVGHFLKDGFDAVVPVETYKQLLELFNENNGAIFHINVPCWMLNILYYVLECRKAQKVIWDVYDFWTFVSSAIPEKRQRFEPLAEMDRYVLENVDGIVFQDDPAGFELHVRPLVNRQMPVLHFNQFVMEEFTVGNGSKRVPSTQDVTINYAGGMDKYRVLCCRALARAGCKLQIYMNPFVKPFDRTLTDEENVTFFSSTFPPTLQKEIAKSDYAFLMHNEQLALQGKYSFSQRILNYLEAGIPMITSSHWEYMATLVKAFNVGVILEDEAFLNARDILTRQDYPGFLRGIASMRLSYNLRRNIHRIMELYRRVCD